MKQELNNLLKSILDDGNIFEFEINSEDNEGLIINEWSVEDDGGTLVPSDNLTSQVIDIDLDTALELSRDLGVMYPVIVDSVTGETLQ